jgi:hypothetical protein
VNDVVHHQRWNIDPSSISSVPLSRRLLAVPFVGKDSPSPNSEFANPEVLIGLSLLSYRYEGLRQSDVSAMATHLQMSLQAELGPTHARPSHVLFTAWTRDRSVTSGDGALSPTARLPLEFLRTSDDKDMARLHALLTLYPPAILYYLCNLVFPPLLRHQSSKLTASGCDLGNGTLFGLRLGFSGTPSHLLPVGIGKCQFEPGSSAQVVTVLSSGRTMGYTLVQRWSLPALLRWVAQVTIVVIAIQISCSFACYIFD